MSFLRHGALTLLAMLVSLAIQAQDDWNVVLDRYEDICNRCIILRERITSGEAVSNAEVTGLLGELARMRTMIQDSESRMSASQRRRFREIRSRYETSSGKKKESGTIKKTVTVAQGDKKPPTPDTVATRPSALLPEVIEPIKGLPLTLDAAEEKGIAPLTFSPASPTVKTPLFEGRRTDIIVLAELGVKPSFGLFASMAKGHWGAYVCLRSNLSPLSADYTTDADCNIVGGGKFWGNGNSRYGSLSVSAGPVWHINDAFGLYLGAVYGNRCLAWQDMSGDWARVSDYSYKGLGAEAGLVASLRYVDFLAGACWLGGWSAILGIGYAF